MTSTTSHETISSQPNQAWFRRTGAALALCGAVVGVSAMAGPASASDSGSDLSLSIDSETTDRATIWSIEVTNDGPGIEPGPLALVVSLPEASEGVATTGDGWTCDISSSMAARCTHNGPLAVGDTTTNTVQAILPAGTRLDLTASVIGTASDPDLTNNAATHTVSVPADHSQDLDDDGDLPHTGAGLSALLASVGAGLTLTGRRLTRLATVRA